MDSIKKTAKKDNILFQIKRGFWQEQKASAAVVVALALTVLVGMLALVGDVGLAFLTRTQLARAADAAVLAGAAELDDGAAAARENAEDYLRLNGVDPFAAEIAIDLEKQEVSAEIESSVQFFFAPVLGRKEGQVKVHAKARSGGVTAVRGAVPVGIEEQQLVFGQKYFLKWGANANEMSSPLGSGNFGIFDLDGGGSGASVYREYAAGGFPGVLNVGDILSGETGNNSGPTLQGFGNRIDACGGLCTWQDFRADCPRLVLIPVYHDLGGNGSNQQVQIVGFASFWLEEVGGNGSQSYLSGYLVRRNISSDFSITQKDFGLRSTKLVE